MARRNPRGVTLIELVVTMAIATILLTGLTYMLTTFGRSTLIETSVTEVQLELQSALSFMTDELRQARYIYNTDSTTFGEDPTTYAIDRLHLDPLNPPVQTQPGDLSNTNFDKSQLVQANSEGFRILLAFWIPSVMGSARLPEGDPAVAKGVPLAVSLTDNRLVIWGTSNAIPAYNLVIYYVTDPPPDSGWQGPRILERWESLPVAIRFEEFAQAENRKQFLNPATLDSNGPTTVDSVFLRTLPPADSASFVLADQMERTGGLDVRYLSPQTIQLSIQGSLEGSQADKYLASSRDSDDAQTYLRSTQGDALSYTTTVISRNVCMLNNICVKDP